MKREVAQTRRMLDLRDDVPVKVARAAEALINEIEREPPRQDYIDSAVVTLNNKLRSYGPDDLGDGITNALSDLLIAVGRKN